MNWDIDLSFKNNYGPVAKNHCPFKMDKQITVVWGKRNLVLRSLENVEKWLTDITQNFESRDIELFDRLSRLKCNHEDKS